MTNTTRAVAALVFTLAACTGVAAQDVGGRFGVGYAVLEAYGRQLFFPGDMIELRIVPFRVFGGVLLGTDIRLAEDVSFEPTRQVGDVAASIRLVAVVPSGERTRFSVFAGPSLHVSMDPAYGSIVEVGGLLGSGAEVFPAQRFSVGFDVGVGMTGVDDSARFCVFAGLVTRFYFL